MKANASVFDLVNTSLPPASAVEVIESVLCVCLCALSRLCRLAYGQEMLHDIMLRHVTSHNEFWGKGTLKYTTREVHERWGIFIHHNIVFSFW